jgi:hypothetical protein
MTGSDSDSRKDQGKRGMAFDGSHLKVPKNDVFPTKFKDASHIKVPPKPASTTKPEK